VRSFEAAEAALVWARGIAEELGESFLTYLIDMAIFEAKAISLPTGNDNNSTRNHN
jgi:hypothetical protein